jgi:hypothetical protein
VIESGANYMLCKPVGDWDHEVLGMGSFQISIEEKKGVNIEKYVENKLHIKICLFWN